MNIQELNEQLLQIETDGLTQIDGIYDMPADKPNVMRVYTLNGPHGNPSFTSRAASKSLTKSYYSKEVRSLRERIQATLCKFAIDILPNEEFLKNLTKKIVDAIVKVVPIGIDIIMELLRSLLEKAVMAVLKYLLDLVSDGVHTLCEGVEQDSPAPIAIA